MQLQTNIVRLTTTTFEAHMLQLYTWKLSFSFKRDKWLLEKTEQNSEELKQVN